MFSHLLKDWSGEKRRNKSNHPASRKVYAMRVFYFEKNYFLDLDFFLSKEISSRRMAASSNSRF